MRPRVVVETADLDHWMAVCSVVNELAVADVHAGMRNLVSGGAEKEEVAGLQVFTFDGNYSRPCGLLVGIARHVDAAGAKQHLSETRAVIAEAGKTSP